MTNLRTIRVVYWANVSESSGAGLLGLSQIDAIKWVFSQGSVATWFRSAGQAALGIVCIVSQKWICSCG